MKFYSPLNENRKKDTVTIKNESLFTDVAAFQLEYTLLLDGYEKHSGSLQVAVAPGAEKEFTLSWPEEAFAASGEYCIHTKLVTKEEITWAPKGFEIAFGQHIFSQKAEVKQADGNKKMKVVHGDINIGVHGTDFSIMFSRQVGSLISIKYSSKEMISTPPAPLFWRATTDNDRGFAQEYHSGAWFAASLARNA